MTWQTEATALVCDVTNLEEWQVSNLQYVVQQIITFFYKVITDLQRSNCGFVFIVISSLNSVISQNILVLSLLSCFVIRHWLPSSKDAPGRASFAVDRLINYSPLPSPILGYVHIRIVPRDGYFIFWNGHAVMVIIKILRLQFFREKLVVNFCFFSNITKGGQAYLFFSLPVANPQILALFLLSRIRKFLRCASPQIENPQLNTQITKSANFLGVPISNPHIFHHRTERMKHLFFSALSCKNLIFHSI